MNTYDLLIPTIPHRHAFLCELLAELDRQWQPGVGVRVYRDNLQATLREKNQALLESSGADYVSWLDDDDWLAPNYLDLVMHALRDGPDYVGFQVHWSIDGVTQLPVEHSLAHQGWVNGPDRLTRDITALNPIRRELALLGRWDFCQDHGADRSWAQQVTASGRVKTEVFIPAIMYHYRFGSADSFLSPREPWPGPLPGLPSYPWLATL
jgi:hypothetical protein